MAMDPLMVLVEVHDTVGKVTVFYIRDGRSRTDLLLGLRWGGQM